MGDASRARAPVRSGMQRTTINYARIGLA